MVSDVLATLIAAIILVLPWSLKQAGLFDKVKGWYKILFSSLLVGLLSVMLGASSAVSIIGQGTSVQITTGIDIIALILFIISVLGIVKNLLVK